MPFRIARLPLTFLVLSLALTLGASCTKRTPALASAHPGEGGASAEGDGTTPAGSCRSRHPFAPFQNVFTR